MNHRTSDKVKIAAACALAIALLGQSTAAQAAGACKFSVVPSANPRPNGNLLYAVAATSPRDAWAVGVSATTTRFDALIEHWNGHAWKLVPGANPGRPYNLLFGTAATSTSDAWAVGEYVPMGSREFQPLIEHWNGHAWSAVPSPPTGTRFGAYLHGIVAISRNNVWAAGVTIPVSNHGQTLIEHWNGTNWAIVPSPNVNNINNQLGSIVANSARDIWAAGSYSTPTISTNQTLTEHWNGSTWSIVPSPNMNPSTNDLNVMAAISPTRVYAAGSFQESLDNFDTLAETWNGSSWAIVPSPDHGTNSTIIYGMAGSISTGVIAVGQYLLGNSNSPARTFAMMLTPSGWKVVPSDNVGVNGSIFGGATAIPGTDNAWGVGVTNNADTSPHTTLIELFNC